MNQESNNPHGGARPGAGRKPDGKVGLCVRVRPEIKTLIDEKAKTYNGQAGVIEVAVLQMHEAEDFLS